MIKLKDIISYEDESFVVVNKPVGILSIPDRFDAEKANIFSILRNHYPEIYSVHRLDKETSGILIYAKTKEVHRYLSRAFEDRSVCKFYLALVNGVVLNDEGLIDKKIDKDRFRPGKMVVSGGGKESQTGYRVLERFDQCSLIEAELLTGRTHQIRVHMQAIGHPLLVDPDYGGKEMIFLSDIKKKKFKLGKYQEEQPVMTRVTLHAYRLNFRHPYTHEEINFEVAPPKDFAALLNQLRKWSKKPV